MTAGYFAYTGILDLKNGDTPFGYANMIKLVFMCRAFYELNFLDKYQR